MKRFYETVTRIRQTVTGQRRSSTNRNSKRNNWIRRQSAGMDPAVRQALVTSMQSDLHRHNDCHDGSNENRQHDRQQQQQEHDNSDPEQENPSHRDVDDDLLEIDQQLDTVRSLLKDSIEREQFLGMRTRQYRKVLDQRARSLRKEEIQLQQERSSDQDDDDDDESQEEDNRNDDNDNNVADAVVVSAEDLEQQAVADADLQRWNDRRADLEHRKLRWEEDETKLTQIVVTQKGILATCEEMRRKIRELEKKRSKIMLLRGECEDFLDAAAAHAVDDDQGNQNSDGDAPLLDEDDGLEDGLPESREVSSIELSALTTLRIDEEPAEMRIN